MPERGEEAMRAAEQRLAVLTKFDVDTFVQVPTRARPARQDGSVFEGTAVQMCSGVSREITDDVQAVLRETTGVTGGAEEFTARPAR